MSNLIKLSKGEILIRENDASNSLYYVQSGALRVFKKKGKGFVEFGVINQGCIVGELSFFDNQLRSASVEALRDSEVVEVPRANFEDYMSKQPAWASALLRTMSSKVRDLTESVKELESNSTSTKLDANNRTVQEHEFLPAREVMKLCSALLLGATLRGARNAAGVTQFPATTFQVLASDVSSIPFAKIAAFTDILKELGLLEMERGASGLLLGIRDLSTLDRFLFWLSDDTAKSNEFRPTLSKLGVQLGEMILSTGVLQNVSGSQEYQTVDLVSLARQLASQHGLNAQLYFDIFDEFAEQKLGRIAKGEGGKTSYEVNVRKFLADFPMVRIRMRIDALNEQKRGIN